jgi:hypothetical protein
MTYYAIERLRKKHEEEGKVIKVAIAMALLVSLSSMSQQATRCDETISLPAVFLF